jgi:hypothetical protein
MKALKVHLAVSIIYGLIILYIFDGESITKKEKIFIVLGLLFINLMVLLWEDVDYN